MIIIIILDKLPICNTEVTKPKYLKPYKQYKVKSVEVLVVMCDMSLEETIHNTGTLQGSYNHQSKVNL